MTASVSSIAGARAVDGSKLAADSAPYRKCRRQRCDKFQLHKATTTSFSVD
jgi:hypothetical protein